LGVDIFLQIIRPFIRFQWGANLYLTILFWNPAAYDEPTIAKHLYAKFQLLAARLLLGETQIARLVRCEAPQNVLEVEEALPLSQSLWNRALRRALGRASLSPQYSAQSSLSAPNARRTFLPMGSRE
jgi:hypothetical protein